MFCEHGGVMRAIEAMCNTLLPLRLLAGAVPELTDIRRIKLNGLGRSPRDRGDLRRRLGGQAQGHSGNLAWVNRCDEARRHAILGRKKRPGRKAWVGR